MRAQLRPKLFLVRVREGIYSLSVLTAAEMHTDARVRVRVRVRGRVRVRVFSTEAVPGCNFPFGCWTERCMLARQSTYCGKHTHMTAWRFVLLCSFHKFVLA